MTATNVLPILRTADVERLVAFYCKALGAQIGFRFEDACVAVTLGSGSLGVGRVDGVRSGDSVSVWIYVDDVDAAHAATLAAGAVEVSAPTDALG